MDRPRRADRRRLLRDPARAHRSAGPRARRQQGRLANDTNALGAFDEALLTYGYLNDQASLYEGPNYSVREQNAFEVVDGFPCITEADVPTGVGDVTYRTQLAALQRFAVPVGEALTATVAP